VTAPVTPLGAFGLLSSESMARREWQNPSVLTRQSANGLEFYIRYREKRFIDGKLKRVEKWRALGLCAKMTKRQAERERDKIMREVNNQVYTSQSQMPWEQYAARFDQLHVSTLATPTQNNYRQQLKTHITPVFTGKRLCDIGPLEVRELFAILENSGVAKTTRHTIRGVVGAAFKCAVNWRILESSPAKGANIGKGPRRVRERRVPDLADIERLMAACDGDVPLLIETLCVTGMRISEAAGLRVSDLNFDRGRIAVQRRQCRGDIGATKSDAGTRNLPMGAVAVGLKAHVAGKAAEDWVFTHDGKPIVDNTLLANYLTPRMVKLGIKFPGFGWHTFRRLHLTLMSQREGLTLFDLRLQAGHASVRTTQEYIVDDADRRAEAVKALPFLVRPAKSA
jgi:integrase